MITAESPQPRCGWVGDIYKHRGCRKASPRRIAQWRPHYRAQGGKRILLAPNCHGAARRRRQGKTTTTPHRPRAAHARAAPKLKDSFQSPAKIKAAGAITFLSCASETTQVATSQRATLGHLLTQSCQIVLAHNRFATAAPTTICHHMVTKDSVLETNQRSQAMGVATQLIRQVSRSTPTCLTSTAPIAAQPTAMAASGGVGHTQCERQQRRK